MKITKSDLSNLIKEAVKKETVGMARRQKRLMAYTKVCIVNTPQAKPNKNINEASLLEFFGTSKKEKTAIQSYRANVKEVVKMAKEVEDARKKLVSLKLSDVGPIQASLDQYIVRLYDLYEIQDMMSLDKKVQAEISKPFAVASNTLKKLSRMLAKASDDLLAAVPKNSSVYSAGQEASDIAAAQKKFMMGPGQRLKKFGKDMFDLGGGGGGVGRSRPQ